MGKWMFFDQGIVHLQMKACMTIGSTSNATWTDKSFENDRDLFLQTGHNRRSGGGEWWGRSRGDTAPRERKRGRVLSCSYWLSSGCRQLLLKTTRSRFLKLCTFFQCRMFDFRMTCVWLSDFIVELWDVRCLIRFVKELLTEISLVHCSLAYSRVTLLLWCSSDWACELVALNWRWICSHFRRVSWNGYKPQFSLHSDATLLFSGS